MFLHTTFTKQQSGRFSFLKTGPILFKTHRLIIYLSPHHPNRLTIRSKTASGARSFMQA